jgi:hypothetical protein
MLITTKAKLMIQLNLVDEVSDCHSLNQQQKQQQHH